MRLLAPHILAALLFSGWLLPHDTHAAPRRMAERAAFVRQNPCPATNLRRGACPGWEVDHVVPLCAGGADVRSNMQWLTVPAHREKTRLDRRHCRRSK